MKVFQDNFFKYKLIQDYQYNNNYNKKDYYPKKLGIIMTPLVKGFYNKITQYNYCLFNTKGDVNLAIRYQIYGQNKYLIEVEMFMVSNDNIKIFENLFYVYFNESSDKIDLLEEIIKNWNSNALLVKENQSYIKNEGILIEIKNNNFQEKLKNLTNFKFINLQKEDDSELEKELLDKENIEKFLSIGHNYINSQAVFNNQDKLLILTGNNFDNLFSLIKIVTYLLYRIFLECRGFKNKVGDAKTKIYDKFDELKKKILNHRTEFTKKPSINIVVNMEDYKSSIKPKKNDIDNNDLIITGLDIKKDEKLSLINSSDFIDNNIINEEDNSKIIDIDKNINDINKPQNIVKSIKDNNNNETITLFIGTFNVNALESELIKLTNLDPFLFPEKLKNYFTQSNYPTFYAIGLEEIMELKTKNILLNPKNDQVKTWEKKISQVLQEKFNYFLYHKAQLVGILFLFFVKASKINIMYNKHGKILKTGNMNLGNKGCCFLDFEYRGTSYGFCSGHLPAGQNEKDYNNRKEVLKKILDFKVSVNDFKNNDFFFIFGDLNFRISTKIGLANLQNHIKILLADSPPENKKMIKMNSENIF